MISCKDRLMPRALICGISGQDGGYLAQFLLLKGYQVYGTSRDASANSFRNLERLGIRQQVSTVSMASGDFGSILATLKTIMPDEVYYFSGQSSVGLSFEQPAETMQSIAMGTVLILEAIRTLNYPVRFYSAGTSECFGDTGDGKATEITQFCPRSPYAVAKAAAHNLVATYRDSYGIYACTGVLFNHESPLRLERFVTQKIVHSAARIASGHREKLKLGNLDIYRDWGWAPEYVQAMWLMLQQDSADDFVIATGKTVSLEYFVSRAFNHFGLDWNEHVIISSDLRRPTDFRIGRSDPSKANLVLGWSARTLVDEVVDLMCEAACSPAPSGM